MKGEEQVAATVAGICAVLLLALWATGAASAAIFGPGWISVPAGDLPTIAAHLAARPGRPADVPARGPRRLAGEDFSNHHGS